MFWIQYCLLFLDFVCVRHAWIIVYSLWVKDTKKGLIKITDLQRVCNILYDYMWLFDLFTFCIPLCSPPSFTLLEYLHTVIDNTGCWWALHLQFYCFGYKFYFSHIHPWIQRTPYFWCIPPYYRYKSKASRHRQILFLAHTSALLSSLGSIVNPSDKYPKRVEVKPKQNQTHSEM